MGVRLAAALLSGALGTGGAFALPTPGQELATAQIAHLAASCLPADKVPTAVAIKLAESGHRFDEVNDTPATGDLSYGGWQINMLGQLGPARRLQYGLASNDDLLDPATNARVMCEMSGGGENWAPWSTYNSGAYLDYMPEAESVAGQASSAPVAAPSGSPAGGGWWWPSLGDVAEGLWQQVGDGVHAIGRAVNGGDTPELSSIYNDTLGKIGGSYTPTATGGGVYTPVAVATPAALPGSEGLQPAFAQQLARLAAAAPGAITITSGYRSTVEQEQIVANHGGECGVWVACVTNGVCGSMHCKGLAADLAFQDDATDAWAHANLARFGLVQPMDYEPWHVELAGARG